MGYLSDVNNEIIVDAILTKAGREKLASGQKLDITKFALSDDEVDYNLYNTNHPNGTDFFDIAIRKMPILEAVPAAESTTLRYKLFTSATSIDVPYTLSVSPPAIFSTGVWNTGNYMFNPIITPALSDAIKNQVFYQAVMPLANNRYISLVGEIMAGSAAYQMPDDLAKIIQANGGSTTVSYAGDKEADKGAAPPLGAVVGSVAAYGLYFTVNVIAIPKSKTSYTIVVNSMGGGISSRPATVTIVLDSTQEPGGGGTDVE